MCSRGIRTDLTKELQSVLRISLNFGGLWWKLNRNGCAGADWYCIRFTTATARTHKTRVRTNQGQTSNQGRLDPISHPFTGLKRTTLLKNLHGQGMILVMEAFTQFDCFDNIKGRHKLLFILFADLLAGRFP